MTHLGNTTHETSRQEEVRVVCIIVITLTPFVLALRLISRFMSARKLSWDDFLSVLAVVSSFEQVVTIRFVAN